MNDENQALIAALQHKKQLIDADIVQFCDQFAKQAEKEYTMYSRVIAEAYCAILQRGGKRLRGALAMTAYEMLGGDDQTVAIQAARIVELLHAHLLIIDDICDRSSLRRGGPSAHLALAETHRAARLQGNSEHFGLSQAINTALLGGQTAELEVARLPISDEQKYALLNRLQQTTITTIHGQINDIYNEALQTVSEGQVEKVLRWKTAYYSFVGPLQLGAQLAEADSGSLVVLEEYSQHIGLAFQIADDILGTFGRSFESGKSALDDLREGKITLLIAKALERADHDQKQILLDCLGNQDLTPKQLEACKQVIEDTGALDFARQLAERATARAISALEAAPSSWAPEGMSFLRDLAGFVIDRKS